MAGNPKQKMKLLVMAEFLRRYSDEDHPVSISDVEKYLAKKNISSERKSIYRDIDVLREYGLPIEHLPHKGYYVTELPLRFSEIMLLVDAVLASPVISRKKTAALIETLEGLGNVHWAKHIRNRSRVEGLEKSHNEELYYNIEKINQAINRGVKISFLYQKCSLVGNIPAFDAGREFIISPYATVWHEDKYYIIGNYEKYDNLSHYRLDRMHRVECTDERVRGFQEVSSYKNSFDTSDYTKKVFNMFAGSSQRSVELVCENRLLEHIVERFGLNLP
ncbi:MAG: WYL domain-containing protein, partial [Oscillospiraceae bacterium]|nr:WYL domain-containing protein [Oscillospiraceae bacterium]